MVQIDRGRFALGSYQYLRYPLEYFLDTAVELEIQNVELWAAAPSFCLDTMDEGQLRKKAALIRERELKVCCITPEQCQYPVNLAAEDEAIRAYSIRNFERAFHPAVHMALGDGSLPIVDYLEQIEGIGYRGFYALEVNDTRYREEPWKADRQSIKWLQNHQVF